MKVILYCPDDMPGIVATKELFKHILECDNCRRLAYGSEAKFIKERFDYLDSITSEDIPLYAFQTAIDFCEEWLDKHCMFSGLDSLATVVPHGHA